MSNQVDTVFTDIRNQGFCAALLRAAAEKPYHTFTEQPILGLHITLRIGLQKRFLYRPNASVSRLSNIQTFQPREDPLLLSTHSSHS